MVRSYQLRTLDRKIAFSTFIQYGGKALQLLMSVVSIKLISGFLTEQGYGFYATMTEFALFLSTMANLGIFGNTVRKMADAPQDVGIFGNMLILRMVTAGLFFILGIFWLMTTGASGAFILGVGLFLGSLFFDYVTVVCDGMLQVNYLMGRATFALVAGKVLNLVFLLLFQSSLGVDAEWVFLGVFLGSLLTMVLSLGFVRMRVKWTIKDLFRKVDIKLLQMLFLSSLPFGIINAINNLYFRFLPDYFAHDIMNSVQFGSFNISMKITQVLSLLSTFLMFSVLPGYRQYLDNREFTKFRKLLKQISAIIIVVGSGIFVLGASLGQFLIETLTHKKYFIPELWFVFPMLLFLSVISYGYDFVLLTLFAMDEDIWFMKREFVALGIGLTLFFAAGLFDGFTIQLMIILVAAIIAEGFMVLAGALRIRKKLAELTA